MTRNKVFALQRLNSMENMTDKQIQDIKEKVKTLSGEIKVQYLRGLRDGADLSMLISEDKKWNLAGDEKFQSFLDYLDGEN